MAEVLREHIPHALPRDRAKELIHDRLEQLGLTVVEYDMKRPWGGFFRIADEQARVFSETFFSGTDFSFPETPEVSISPKILYVEEGKRLSLQYHHRRAEFWRVVKGPVGVVLGDEQQTQQFILEQDDSIAIPQGHVHRLVGLEKAGLVAEAWIHKDRKNPSTEDDIVRLNDDFGRK